MINGTLICTNIDTAEVVAFFFFFCERGFGGIHFDDLFFIHDSFSACTLGFLLLFLSGFQLAHTSTPSTAVKPIFWDLPELKQKWSLI